MKYKDIEVLDRSIRVFEDGSAHNLTTGNPCSWSDNGNGYQKIVVHAKPKPVNKYVHRLVAECFLEKPSEEHNQVNHRDGDKKNNHYRNLEWATGKENIKHAHGTGAMSTRSLHGPINRLTKRKVCKMYVQVKRGASIGSTAKEYGISRTTLSSVINKRCHVELTDFLDEHLT